MLIREVTEHKLNEDVKSTISSIKSKITELLSNNVFKTLYDYVKDKTNYVKEITDFARQAAESGKYDRDQLAQEVTDKINNSAEKIANSLSPEQGQKIADAVKKEPQLAKDVGELTEVKKSAITKAPPAPRKPSRPTQPSKPMGDNDNPRGWAKYNAEMNDYYRAEAIYDREFDQWSNAFAEWSVRYPEAAAQLKSEQTTEKWFIGACVSLLLMPGIPWAVAGGLFAAGVTYKMVKGILRWVSRNFLDDDDADPNEEPFDKDKVNKMTLGIGMGILTMDDVPQQYKAVVQNLVKHQAQQNNPQLARERQKFQQRSPEDQQDFRNQMLAHIGIPGAQKATASNTASSGVYDKKQANNWAYSVYIGKSKMGDVPPMYSAKVKELLGGGYDMPKAWKEAKKKYQASNPPSIPDEYRAPQNRQPQNVPTLTDTVPKNTAQSQSAQVNQSSSADKYLQYAVYLYAIQQLYGQDTAKVRQALQQYIQATGNRAGVNQLFNSVKQEVTTSQATADALAQKLLTPAMAKSVIDGLLQSVAGAEHEEF